MSPKGKHWLLSGCAVILGALAFFYIADLLDVFKSPQQRILGQWAAEDRSAAIEFLEGGVARARVMMDLDSQVKLAMAGESTFVSATIAGLASIEGRWEIEPNSAVSLFLPFRIGNDTMKFPICQANRNGSVLAVAAAAAKTRPVILSKLQFRSPVDVIANRPAGYHVPDMSMSGIMIADNVYMAMGSRSGGEIRIASGFTIQRLPAILKLEAGALSISLSSKEGPIVKALVSTQGGFRLATTYQGARIAYEVAAGANEVPTYSLDSVTSATGQATCADCFTFRPRYVAFAALTEPRP